MNFCRIVPQSISLFSSRLPNWFNTRSPILSSNNETNLSTWVGGNSSISIFHRGIILLDGIHQWFNDIQMQPNIFSLSTNNSSIPQTAVHGIIKRSFEKHRRRSNGIRRVSNNNIKVILILLHKLCPIHNLYSHPRIIISDRKRWKVLFRVFDDICIKLANVNFLDTRVLCNLPQNSSISTANHQNFLRVWMSEQRNMRHHFLVGEFILFSDLDDTVEYENSSMVRGGEDENVLEFGAAVVEHFLDFNGHGLSWPEFTAFVEPSVDNEVHTIESLLWLFVSHIIRASVAVQVYQRC
mmetsp:Transcript_10075/g.15120  ORF Transcript_10075/g.15120 Transcript_10075/m.15120 type:complete len:296 (+) Transcript_10075:280-1167(+)